MDEYVFSTRDVMAAFDNNIEPLFPDDPEMSWDQWQEPKPLPGTLRQVVELPGRRIGISGEVLTTRVSS